MHFDKPRADSTVLCFKVEAAPHAHNPVKPDGLGTQLCVTLVGGCPALSLLTFDKSRFTRQGVVIGELLIGSECRYRGYGILVEVLKLPL